MGKSVHVLCGYLELFTVKFLKIIKKLTLIHEENMKLDVVPRRMHVRLHKFQSNCMKIEPFRTYTSINSTICACKEVEIYRKLKVNRKLK